VCPNHCRPPLWRIGFSSSAHWLSYTEYIMCKLSFIHLVNENYSIISLLLLFSSIFSATVYVNSQLDLLCAGSTHLHLFLTPIVITLIRNHKIVGSLCYTDCWDDQPMHWYMTTSVCVSYDIRDLHTYITELYQH
jgi:hypothetical protein